MDEPHSAAAFTPPSVIKPDWPAPARIHAFTTVRSGGVSEGPWESLNLGLNSGDRSGQVEQNREIVSKWLPSEPRWLQQCHGARVLFWERAAGEPQADGIVSVKPDQVCAVLTADCLPVFLCREDGTAVAAVHAGWRGLIAGILAQAVEAIGAIGAIGDQQGGLLAWLGPAIGPSAYEVRADFRDRFLAEDSRFEECFSPGLAGCWYADLYAIARHYLERSNVSKVYGGSHCTFSDASRFYSYRRDGITGRMASVIWIAGE